MGAMPGHVGGPHQVRRVPTWSEAGLTWSEIGLLWLEVAHYSLRGVSPETTSRKRGALPCQKGVYLFRGGLVWSDGGPAWSEGPHLVISGPHVVKDWVSSG